MHRARLVEMLDHYAPADPGEEASRRRMIDFVRQYADCFRRSLSHGHVTGSAWLVDAAGDRALLTFHRKLGRWLQLGGHADGEPDILAVALREAREESGIADITPLSTDIFDVDVHEIPARGREPLHFHYDVRFLLRAGGAALIKMSDESLDLRWFSADQIPLLDTDDSVRRMVRKWDRLRRSDEWPLCTSIASPSSPIS